MLASSFGFGCIKRNFLFMLTGKGKGLFNIFVGSIIIACDTGKSVAWYNYAMGGASMGTGLLFIGLSTCRNMTDDQLDAAMAVSVSKAQKDAAKKKGLKIAIDNKDTIK